MKSSVKAFLGFLAIVVIYYAVTSFGGGSSATVEFGQSSMTLRGPQEFSLTLDYLQIESLEVVTLPKDLGTVVSGGDAFLTSWGERENELWGNYTLFISKKIENAVLITTTDGDTIVYNYESEEACDEMINMITAMKERQEAAQ